MDLSQHLRLLLPGDSASADELSKVQGSFTLTRLHKGDPLIVDGPVDGAFVTAGCLRVYFTEADGTERTLYFAPEGWWVPSLDGLDPGSSACIGVDALERTDVWLVARTPEAGAPARLWSALDDQAVTALQRRLVGAMRKSAADRYVEFQRVYPGLDARIPQYHVAEYLGISAEFLSKMRSRLLREDARAS